MQLNADSEVIAWLLEGDPAIRWQVMRDLLDGSPADNEAERQRTLAEGWGQACLDRQTTGWTMVCGPCKIGIKVLHTSKWRTPALHVAGLLCGPYGC